MTLTERFDVSPAKLEALLARITRLNINPALIEERFTRGGDSFIDVGLVAFRNFGKSLAGRGILRSKSLA